MFELQHPENFANDHRYWDCTISQELHFTDEKKDVMKTYYWERKNCTWDASTTRRAPSQAASERDTCKKIINAATFINICELLVMDHVLM